MKTILVDLNIIIDYLADRNESEKAGELFAKCFQKKLKAFVCAHEITTLAYYLGKIRKNRIENIKIISQILKIFDVLEINKTILEKAVVSNIADFEDAVIVESAKEKKIDYIITRNIKDFKNSSIPAILPEEYLTRK
ncbi:MAG: PIN domain-containing protein [Spirochaetaceae bacterium]|nr:PIN domain-containing protein [Spirochaetaceae bacterium]